MTDGVWRDCKICGKKYFVATLLVTATYQDEFCPDSIKHFAIKRKEKSDKLPQETKQKILDTLRDGKTIGEICKELELGLDVVSGVIHDNIKSVSLLNRKAV